MKRIVLCFLAGMLLLPGCGKKEENEPPKEVVVAEELAADPKEEEPVPEEEPKEEEEKEEAPEEEPAEEEEEPDEEDLRLQEYQEDMDRLMYSMEVKGTKYSYYVQDIDGDGFPEVFQIGYQDQTAAIQDLYLNVGIVNISASQHCDAVLVTDACIYSRKNTEEDPEGGVMEFCYSSDGKDLMVRSFSVGVPQRVTGPSFYDSLSESCFVYKDHEFLKNGSRQNYRAGKDSEYNYMVWDASGRIYYDEEHFDHFDLEVYENTLTFTENCGWFTLEEAFEHPGEFPQ